ASRHAWSLFLQPPAHRRSLRLSPPRRSSDLTGASVGPPAGCGSAAAPRSAAVPTASPVARVVNARRETGSDIGESSAGECGVRSYSYAGRAEEVSPSAEAALL